MDINDKNPPPEWDIDRRNVLFGECIDEYVAHLEDANPTRRQELRKKAADFVIEFYLNDTAPAIGPMDGVTRTEAKLLEHLRKRLPSQEDRTKHIDLILRTAVLRMVLRLRNAKARNISPSVQESMTETRRDLGEKLGD